MLIFGIVLLRFVFRVSGEVPCPLGKYGEGCSLSCPQHCARLADNDVPHCDKQSGSCSSWCVAGWYGDTCISECSTYCINSICNQQNGHCTLGCTETREGDFCEILRVRTTAYPSPGSSTTETHSPGSTTAESTPPGSSTTASTTPGSPPSPYVFVIPVCIVVIIVISIIAAVLIIRKRRQKRSHSNDPSDQEEYLLEERKRQETGLHFASLVGDLNKIEEILSVKGEEVNCRGEDGKTPLMCAVSEGRIKAMKLLLSKGADVSLVDDNGENILHEACLGGHTEMVEHVLSLENVDINQKGKYGRTPVMKAAEMGYREVLDVLVSKEGDMTAVDDKGNNILHVACIGGDVDMVKYVLLEDHINSRGQYGRTPVMMAACCRHIEVVEVLKHKGADLSLVDNDGNNILHVACIGGDVDVVKYVLSLDGVDINSKGQYSRTPARMVDFRKHREVFDLLLSKGADLSQVDDKGENILHVVCLEGHLELVKEIITHHRVDINSRGQYGRTPIMKAAEKGHKEVFIFLMIHRSDVFLKDGHDNNILHVACIGGNLEMVQYIVSLGNLVEDVNSRGQYSRTPLLMAAGDGHTEVGKFLVDKGADVSLVDDKSNNILHLACYGGHVEFVKFVLSRNIVDILVANKQGLTAAKIARELANQTVYNVLCSSIEHKENLV